MFKQLGTAEGIVFSKDMLMCAALDTASSTDSVNMMTEHLLEQVETWAGAVGNDAISDAWLEELKLHLLRKQVEINARAARAMMVVNRMK